MRVLNYTVRESNGNYFTTTDYAVAHKDGNHVINTFLVEFDEFAQLKRDIYNRKMKIKKEKGLV